MGSKIVYLHGRPSAHPMHAEFSKSVEAEFMYIDFKMRWQDKDRSMAYRIISWFVCAFTFPKKKSYDIFLVDNLHFSPVIMKFFHLLSRKQKIIAHMGSHTLYFIYAHKFSKITEWIHIQALKRYDALICEGEMAEYLTRKILGEKTPKLYTIFNGIPEEHYPVKESYTTNLSGKNILFMGHGPGENRLWYKGLDLMMDAFSIAYKNDPQLTFTIVGNWEPKLKEELVSKYDKAVQNSIQFVGETNQLDKYTKEASLYLHCARGEAFGLTILIALASGLPSIVSAWTGAKEVIEKIDSRFIVELNAELIAKKINWYFDLHKEEKRKISEKGIDIAKGYTEKRAIEFYQETFKKIEKDFEL